MISPKKWEDFRKSGLLWWVNMILHTFGWAIVFQVDANDKVLDVYPARVKFRGYSESTNTEGYVKLSKYLQENAEELLKESEE